MRESRDAKRRQDADAYRLFRRASERWDQGDLREALRLFLEGATRGDESSRINAGHFYETGLGVKRNPEEALRWYRRAYRRGSALAANRIGGVYEDEQDHSRAVRWYKRALDMGDESSALSIGKLLLKRGRRRDEALEYLTIAWDSSNVSVDDAEEAERLLQDVDSHAAKLQAKRPRRRKR